MFRYSSTHFITLQWNLIDGLHGSLDCFASASSNLIALAGTLSFSRSFGSGRFWIVKDDDDPTGLKYFRILVY